MALSDISDMTNSGSLGSRIVGAAAREGRDRKWANENLYAICSADGWDEKWQAARNEDARKVNPDTGGRPDVIKDEDITAAVQALIDQQAQDAATEQAAQDRRIAELEAKVAELQKQADAAQSGEAAAS